MTNDLRMDFYRLIRSKSLYVCLAILCVFCIIASAVMWYSTTPEYLEAVTQAGGQGAIIQESAEGEEGFTVKMAESSFEEEVSPTLEQYLGFSFLSGGILAILVSLFLVLFVGVEIESGFIKNIFTTSKGRGRYFISKTVLAVVLSLIFIVVGTLVSYSGAVIAGIEVLFDPLDFAVWALLVTLATSAYAMITLFFVMLTKNKTSGIVAACLIASGILGVLAATTLNMFPSFAHVLDYTVNAGFVSLKAGLVDPTALSATHIAAVAGAYFVVFSVLGYICIRKRDM